MQPERGLEVRDVAAGRRPVAERRRRLGIRFRFTPVRGQPFVPFPFDLDVVEDPRDEAAEVPAHEIVAIAERGFVGARFGELVDPFVHPRILELVAADDAVPPLMAGFVNRHLLEIDRARGRNPPRARGE